MSSTDLSSRDPNSEELGDWRLHFTGWAVLPNDPTQTPRAARMMTHREGDLETVSFHTPSAATLHLNSAWKAAVRATAAKSKLNWNRIPLQFASHGFGQKAAAQLDDASMGDLFDFFEDAMISVTSSFAALEAFCNLTLVDRLSGPINVNLYGKLKLLDVQEIERRVSTGQKLDELVPPLLGVPSPTLLPQWLEFKRLQAWRDSITHFKRRDMASPKSEATVLHHLVNLRPLEAPKMAEAILGHFYGAVIPRFMALAPWREMEQECLRLEAPT